MEALDRLYALKNSLLRSSMIENMTEHWTRYHLHIGWHTKPCARGKVCPGVIVLRWYRAASKTVDTSALALQATNHSYVQHLEALFACTDHNDAIPKTANALPIPLFTSTTNKGIDECRGTGTARIHHSRLQYTGR